MVLVDGSTWDDVEYNQIDLFNIMLNKLFLHHLNLKLSSKGEIFCGESKQSLK